jgi:hypothetical protein
MSKVKRLRGLKALVQDAVEHGSHAVERVQKETANRPFTILEAIPPIALPARGVHVIYDLTVSTTHVAVRLVTRLVGVGLDVALDVADRKDPP